MTQILTEQEIEESLVFADGALAAAGHIVENQQSTEDIREALRGKMSRQQFVRRAYRRATSS